MSQYGDLASVNVLVRFEIVQCSGKSPSPSRNRTPRLSCTRLAFIQKAVHAVVEAVIPIRIDIAVEHCHDRIPFGQYIFIRPSASPVSPVDRLVPRTIVLDLAFRRHEHFRVSGRSIIASEIHSHKCRHRAFCIIWNIHQDSHVAALVFSEIYSNLAARRFPAECVMALFQDLEMQSRRFPRLISVHFPT